MVRNQFASTLPMVSLASNLESVYDRDIETRMLFMCIAIRFIFCKVLINVPPCKVARQFLFGYFDTFVASLSETFHRSFLTRSKHECIRSRY